MMDEEKYWLLTIIIFLLLCWWDCSLSWLIYMAHIQGTATRKICTRHDASINENSNIWGIFSRHK